MNLLNANDFIGGLASFSVEAINNVSDSPQRGKKYAGGLYDVLGISTQPAGIVAMGPIVTPLDVGFSVRTSSQVLLAAIDDDGVMSRTSSGANSFSGFGCVYSSTGACVQVAVALVQRGSTPTYVGSQALVGSLNMAPFLSTQGVSGMAEKALQRAQQLASSPTPKESEEGELSKLLR